MTDCAVATTPLAVGTDLCLPEEGYKATAADSLRYQKALGELNHLVGWTRQDIAFAVSALSKYCSNPSPQHFAGLRHVHRYLRGTQDHGIAYRGAVDLTAAPTLSIYSDSDYAACTDDRRAVTGYSVHLGGAAVSWLSTRQRTTAQSTVEAEYIGVGRGREGGSVVARLPSRIGSQARHAYCAVLGQPGEHRPEQEPGQPSPPQAYRRQVPPASRACGQGHRCPPVRQHEGHAGR